MSPDGEDGARARDRAVDRGRSPPGSSAPGPQPTDVTGLSIWNQQARDFEFRAGPIFAHVVLVDEINRAMPKTQSALLEAMAERQVTIDGVTRELSEPFIVLATQNPIELEGTFPRAQLDRFVRTALGYPGGEDELNIVRPASRHLSPSSRRWSRSKMNALQEATTVVYVDDLLQRWIIDLVRTTRGSTSSRSAPRCAAASLSSGPFAAGRSSRAATTSPRRTSSSCSCRCLDTGSCSRRHSSSRSARSAASRRWRTSRPLSGRPPLDQASLGGDGEVVPLEHRMHGERTD